MNIIDIKLKHLKEENEICEIYTDVDNPDKFSVGYILDFDKNYFIIESIDPYGISDGVICDLKENIIRIGTKTPYLEDIKALFDYNKQNRANSIVFHKYIKSDFIRHIFDSKKLCDINLCNINQDNVIGFIEQIDNDYLKIKNISIDGIENGESLIDIKNIGYVSYGSSDLKKIETLYLIKKIGNRIEKN